MRIHNEIIKFKYCYLTIKEDKNFNLTFYFHINRV